MATLWKPAYREVMDSVNWETQVSVSCLNHTEACEWEVGNYTPPFLLRRLRSEERSRFLDFTPAKSAVSLCKHSNRRMLL